MEHKKTKLRIIREKSGYATAREFAKECGVSYSTYAKHEAGIATPPFIKMVQYAEKLGCSLNDLAEDYEYLPSDTYDPKRSELLEHYNCLPENDKDMLLAIARRMCEDIKQ